LHNATRATEHEHWNTYSKMWLRYKWIRQSNTELLYYSFCFIFLVEIPKQLLAKEKILPLIIRHIKNNLCLQKYEL